MLRERKDPAFARAFKRIAQLALVGIALAGLTACGGGGGGSSTAAKAPTPASDPTPTPTPDPTPTPTPTPPVTTPTPPEIPITPAPTDHPDTLEAAADITAGQTVEGSIDSPEDVDFFKLQLTGPSTVTFWTTGEADVAIALKDGEGNDLSATSASSIPGSSSGIQVQAVAATAGVVAAASDGRVSVTTPLEAVYADLRGRQGSTGDYTLHNEVASNQAPRVLRALSAVTIKAGGAPVTVDLSSAFEDPEGGALTFSTSFGAGQVGPVSLGITVSGSVMSITSPANMRPGPVSITVTASDPFGLFTVQVLTVTVQPGDSTPETELDRCITARVDGNDGPCSLIGYEGSEYYIRFTNSCSYRAHVRYSFNPFTPESTGWSDFDSSIPEGGSTTLATSCLPSQPRARYCLYPSFQDNSRCYGDNPRWREL